MADLAEKGEGWWGDRLMEAATHRCLRWWGHVCGSCPGCVTVTGWYELRGGTWGPCHNTRTWTEIIWCFIACRFSLKKFYFSLYFHSVHIYLVKNGNMFIFQSKLTVQRELEAGGEQPPHCSQDCMGPAPWLLAISSQLIDPVMSSACWLVSWVCSLQSSHPQSSSCTAQCVAQNQGWLHYYRRTHKWWIWLSVTHGYFL